MTRTTWIQGLLLAAILATAATAQRPPTQDDFKREGTPEQRKLKDRLEGKAPPKLVVRDWMNTKKPIRLADLRGKVVVLKFWGTW